jgi:hypothetical protein
MRGPDPDSLDTVKRGEKNELRVRILRHGRDMFSQLLQNLLTILMTC